MTFKVEKTGPRQWDLFRVIKGGLTRVQRDSFSHRAMTKKIQELQRAGHRVQLPADWDLRGRDDIDNDYRTAN